MAEAKKAPKAEAAKGATPKEAKSYEVLVRFRSVLNYDQEYNPGDTFTEVDDKERLQNLVDRKFIK